MNGDELDFGVHRQKGQFVHKDCLARNENATQDQTGPHWSIPVTALIRSFTREDQIRGCGDSLLKVRKCLVLMIGDGAEVRAALAELQRKVVIKAG